MASKIHLKKSILLVFITFLCLIPPISTSAASTPKDMVLLDAKNNSLAYVPVRAINGFDDVAVEWDAAEKKVSIVKGDIHLTMELGKKSMQINDQVKTITGAPFREAGATYVPLQSVSEALNWSVTWNKQTSSVDIKHGDNKLTLPFTGRGKDLNDINPIVSEHKTFKVGSRSFSVQMVTVSLLHPNIRLDVALAGDTVGKVENLSGLAKRHQAKVAINGTFFNAYTKDDYKAPYGYIVRGGELKKQASGDKRTIFTFDKNMLAELISGKDFTDRFDQGTIDGGLQAGPRLVVNGKVAIDVQGEGFRDPKILTGGGARSALGITRDHKLILLTTGGATIPQLAQIMKQAGAYQAMNLDGGASSGLYYNGKYLTTPGRQISNAIIIKYQ